MDKAPPRPLRSLSRHRRVVASCLIAAAALTLSGCCVNPFIDTDTNREDVPGAAERETGGTLEEHAPAMQAAEEDTTLTGFDMRLVRVQPGVHLDTEQVCHVSAAGRVEAIAEADGERYGERATQRMSVRCAAVTGEGWADLVFSATSAGHAPEVTVGARVRVRILRADGGFFDYPIVEFVETEALGDPTLAAPGAEGTPAVVGNLPTGFDLRRAQTDPAAVGSVQTCAVSHAGDIEMLDAEDSRSRAYPAGAQNRMTIRCRHAQGEEWADLVFMPAQALTALHIGRGDVIRVAVVSRTGGFFDYPVLQLVQD
ncbi:MAG: hypothetical protein J0L92_36890 [Deltaproteobacteria bacterium]|nr:hypothetical protein [Deltaproteobacteria bacterium]